MALAIVTFTVLMSLLYRLFQVFVSIYLSIYISYRHERVVERPSPLNNSSLNARVGFFFGLTQAQKRGPQAFNLQDITGSD